MATSGSRSAGPLVAGLVAVAVALVSVSLVACGQGSGELAAPADPIPEVAQETTTTAATAPTAVPPGLHDVDGPFPPAGLHDVDGAAAADDHH